MADDAWNEGFSGGQLHVAPDFDFMFVTDVPGPRSSMPGVDTEHDVDDVAQRKIGGVLAMPAAPADMMAHAIERDAFEG